MLHLCCAVLCYASSVLCCAMRHLCCAVLLQVMEQAQAISPFKILPAMWCRPERAAAPGPFRGKDLVGDARIMALEDLETDMHVSPVLLAHGERGMADGIMIWHSFPATATLDDDGADEEIHSVTVWLGAVGAAW